MERDLMSSRKLFASVLMACSAVGFLGITSVANAASAWPSVPKTGGSATTSDVTEIRYRGRPSKRLYLPIVPYIAYDYPYYYRRGHYPTHIGPGYIYYGYPYYYFSRKYGSRYADPRRQRAARRNY